jgi:beta-phosphoglucomutase-like phosphatase (HAD superfamily)
MSRAKPEPDLYEAAVAALGVAGGEAVAFEDSETGTLAAKRAGLWCVAVPNPSTRHQKHTRADLRIESLGGTTLAKIISELGSRPVWVSLR